MHIIPRFVNERHQAFAEQLGVFVGPLAHTKRTRGGSELPCYLVQAPEGWTEMQDNTGAGEQDGPYIIDERGRRRIRFSETNAWHGPWSEVLCRFAVQEWAPGPGSSFCYVRKIVGGENNIFRFRHGAHSVFRTDLVAAFDETARPRHRCTEWLVEHYPDYQNPLAYWDED